MKNNIYVLLFILLILIILIIFFIKTSNLENYAKYSTNISLNDVKSPVLKTWSTPMYLSACDNECNNTTGCQSFISNANIGNTTTGTCTLYNTATISGTPSYLVNNNIYYRY
jgi:hypothetical protein